MIRVTEEPYDGAVAVEGWHRITPYGRYKESPDSVCYAKDLAHG